MGKRITEKKAEHAGREAKGMADAKVHPVAAPWDPEPGWSSSATEAYLAYRNLGRGRTLAAAARTVDKGSAWLGQLSSRDSWQMKVAAYDREQDRISTLGQMEETRKMGERHARQLQAQQTALATPVSEFLKRYRTAQQEGRDFFEDWTDREVYRAVEMVARAMPALVQAERLARGLSTENVEAHVNVHGGPMSRQEAERVLLGIEDGSEGMDDGFIDGDANEVE